MKTGKQSKNIQDARSRGVGSNDYPSYLVSARDRKNAEKFVGGKYSIAKKSKLASEAGINGIGKTKRKKK